MDIVGSSYGWTRWPPPIDQNLGLVVAVPLRHGGKFLFKSLNFWPLFVQKCKKSFQLQGPDPFCPWTPMGPRHLFMLACAPCARSPWSPLSNPGSATVCGALLCSRCLNPPLTEMHHLLRMVKSCIMHLYNFVHNWQSVFHIGKLHNLMSYASPFGQ